MTATFTPAWWLPDRHSRTMWGKFFRRVILPDVNFERLPTEDGDAVTLASASGRRHAPVLLILHGLEGGVRSHYVGGIWTGALAQGWRPMLLLFRTCDGRLNSARRTYHSGETSDLDHVVRHLTTSVPDRAIGLAGVSLGGNVLLKWLGERGEGLPASVRAAVAVSAPFDLARSSRAINNGFARLYQWNFLRSLRKKARQKLGQFPDICSPEVLSAARTLWEFDDCFTAPLHGFRDARDYYQRASSLGFLPLIRTPTLLLSALDDPFYDAGVLDDVRAITASNPCIITEFHRRGGHVGFVEGPPWRPSYYVERRIAQFLSAHLAAVRNS